MMTSAALERPFRPQFFEFAGAALANAGLTLDASKAQVVCDGGAENQGVRDLFPDIPPAEGVRVHGPAREAMFERFAEHRGCRFEPFCAPSSEPPLLPPPPEQDAAPEFPEAEVIAAL